MNNIPNNSLMIKLFYNALKSVICKIHKEVAAILRKRLLSQPQSPKGKFLPCDSPATLLLMA